MSVSVKWVHTHIQPTKICRKEILDRLCADDTTKLPLVEGLLKEGLSDVADEFRSHLFCLCGNPRQVK